MKKLGASFRELADGFGITEAAGAASRLTLSGTRHILIENHRGILSCGREHIAVTAVKGTIHIFGAELSLDAMSAETLIVSGRIMSVELEQI